MRGMKTRNAVKEIHKIVEDAIRKPTKRYPRLFNRLRKSFCFRGQKFPGKVWAS